MANKVWTQTTLGLAIASELNAKAGTTAGSVPSAIADAVAISLDKLWRGPWTLRRITLAWGTDKDVLRQPSAWTGTSDATLAGAYTGTKLDCYTFTADATGTVGTTAGLTISVTDFDGEAVATLAVDDTYTPGTAMTVAAGITIAMSAGTITSAQAFYVDLKHDLSLLPLWDYPGDSTRQYGDFKKLDTDWLHENNSNGSIKFLTDHTALLAIEQSYASDVSIPQVALIEPDQERAATAAGNFQWRARLIPTPAIEVSYTVYYQSAAPTLSLTSAPQWPGYMHEMWELRSKAVASRKLNRNDADSHEQRYLRMLHTETEDDKETQDNSTPMIQDTTGDFSALTSRGY